MTATLSVPQHNPHTQYHLNTKTIEIAGREYLITRLTERCYLLESLRSGVVRQFGSDEALIDFLRGLRAHLERGGNTL